MRRGLNAGGRIDSARRPHELLLSRTVAEAEPIAAELEEENARRKQIEQRIVAEAEAQLESFDFPAHRALVLAGEDWNAGVIGLAASRMVEKYHYPAILLGGGEVLTGSCRSIPGVDIHAALKAVSGRLIRFGGHRQAAGLTIARSELEGFRRDLDEWLSRNIAPQCYVPEQEYDLEVSFAELTEAFVAQLDALQPTGFGNPAPVAAHARAHVRAARRGPRGRAPEADAVRGRHPARRHLLSRRRARGQAAGAGRRAVHAQAEHLSRAHGCAT